MRVLLISHTDAPLHHEGIARWMGSWATLTGRLLIHERRLLMLRRLRRETRRVGISGILDVAAFRAFYKISRAARDSRLRSQQLNQLCERYPPIDPETKTLVVPSPNSPDAERFIRECEPTLVIALCKNILAERIFSIPSFGTFVMHPGICPEYRNAHGCFWALVQRDLTNVGLTLLRIDRGIDTGPIFGYFRAAYDERVESHHTIQDRMLLDNLDAIRDCILRIVAGTAAPISTAGRNTAEWGQPRLTSYFRWRRALRRELRAESKPAALRR